MNTPNECQTGKTHVALVFSNGYTNLENLCQLTFQLPQQKRCSITNTFCTVMLSEVVKVFEEFTIYKFEIILI
jgi:hypothetical protein